MSIHVWFHPCLQRAHSLAKEISGQEIPKNLHGGGDASAGGRGDSMLHFRVRKGHGTKGPAGTGTSQELYEAR